MLEGKGIRCTVEKERENVYVCVGGGEEREKREGNKQM